MKLSAVLLIFGAFVLQANPSYAQKRISLNLENVTVERFLDEIESKTDFRFIYSTADVDIDRRISVVVDKEPVDVVLSKVFTGTRTNFNIDDGQIFLLPSKNPEPSNDQGSLQQTQIRITGTVTDETGIPLNGATVIVKGTSIGVSTDFDGNYEITVPNQESILEFSYIGYETQDLTIGSQTVINVSMKEAVGQLDEVVVSTGYWQEERKVSTGNIGKISSEIIERQPVINPLEALQGQVAGVQIQQTSGTPGSAININIRGLNSLNNGFDGRPNANLPFYVIDGVPFTASSLNSGLNLAGGNPLASIRPSDIESIEVLKDADATAIYGSRGANGVILITTKKGRSGKTRVELDYSQGIGEVPTKVNLLNTEQYLMMRREAIANDGRTLNPADSTSLRDLFLWNPNRDTDWQEELLGGTAEYTNAGVSISGGSEQTQFLMSGNLQRQTNVVRFDDSAFRSFSGHMNLSHTSSNNRLKANLSATYSVNTNNQNGVGLMSQALTLAPNAPALFTELGELNFEDNFENPLAFLEQEFENRTNTLVSNMSLYYELMKGLNLSSSFGYTDSQVKETFIEPLSSRRPENRLTNANSSLVNNGEQTWIIEPKINFGTKKDQGNLNILLGATFQSSTTSFFRVRGENYDSDLLIRDISQAPVLIVNENSFSEYRYSAIYARINYNWNDRYIVNLTGRRDGSSRFGPDKQFGNFGAIGFAWVFSEESLLRNSSLLSFGKLRGSFGLTGNDQIGNYQFLDTFQGSFLDYDGSSGLVASRAANPDYSWEENRKLEFGLELGLFKNRVRLNTSWFRNRSDNQLIGRPLSSVTGFSTVQFNLPALVENRGWEIELNTTNFRTDDFQWTSAFNFSRLRNELVEFPDIEDFVPFNNRYIVGRSTIGRKDFQSLGVDPQTGEYAIVDFDGNGRIGNEDRQNFVEIFQDYFGGLNNSLRWKGLQLDVFLRFVKQNARDFRANFIAPGTTGGDNLSNQPVTVLERWQNPSELAAVQRFTFDNRDAVLGHNRNRLSNNSVVDGSFIRLQNVSLSWTLPQKWADQLKLQQLRIYANGQNLATFTNYAGLDPETRNLSLPPLRIINTGIQLTF